SRWYEEATFGLLKSAFAILQKLEVTTPAFVFLSFLHVRGFTFGLNEWAFPSHRQNHIERDQLIIPEVMVETWSTDPVAAMRPAFDMVWNAFGLERSFNYDENGHWIQR